MKKITLFLLFVLAGLLFAEVSIQEIANLLNHDPFDLTETLLERAKNARDLSLSEKLIQTWQDGAWVNQGRYTYSYDENGFLVVELFQIWSEEQWINAGNTNYSNNPDGQPAEIMLQQWDGTNQVWVDYFWATYEYDENDNLLHGLLQVNMGETWVNWVYATNTWSNDNLLMEVFKEEWSSESNNWVNYEINTYTYDNGNLISYMEQEWQDGAWLNKGLDTYTNNAEGYKIEMIFQQWQESNRSWDNAYQELFEYDGDWNITTEYRNNWSWSGQTWTDYRVKYNTWEDDVLVETLEREWNDSREWIDISKTSNTYMLGIDSEEEMNPISIVLTNMPNPFNPTTTIMFSLVANSRIELAVYNIKGQFVKMLARNPFDKGDHRVTWNGDDVNGKPVSSGVYFFRLKVDGVTEVVRKSLLLK